MSETESYREARAELRAELARIPGYIQQEIAIIEAKVDEGASLIVNEVSAGPVVVHHVDCATIAHQLDRAQAWEVVRNEIEAELAKPNFVPHLLNEVQGKMPSFFTHKEVERLSEYRACGTCQPMLAQREKRWPRKIPTTRLRSLGEQHVGRLFVAFDGEALGRLKSVRVVAEFENGTVISDDAEVVSMVPLDSDVATMQAMIRERAVGAEK